MNRAAILPPAIRRDEATPPPIAETIASSSFQNADLIQRIKGLTEDRVGVFDIAQELESRAQAVAVNDLCHIEMSLISQAASLEALYSNLIGRALASADMQHIEAFFRLGLRAQNQCRATLETLATIKNPPVVFAKQANISGGHQQINNAPAHGKNETVPNKLMDNTRHTEALGVIEHERLDTRTPRQASGHDSPMEAVGAVNRSQNTRRQSKVKPQCLQAEQPQPTDEVGTH